MGYTLYSRKEQKLQKKLIPLNLIVAILSLVAAISLIFTPLLKVNVGTLLKEAAVLFDDGGEGTASAVEADGGEGEQSVAIDIKKTFELMGDILNAEIEINPVSMAEVLFAPAEEKVSLVTDEFLVNNGAFEKMAVSIVNVALVSVAGEENKEILDSINLEELNEALHDFDGVKSKNEFHTKIDGFLDVLQGQPDIEISADDESTIREELNKMYDKTADNITGEFTAEKMICVNLSPEGDNVYTSYKELITGMGSSDSESGNQVSAAFAQVNSILEMAAPYYGYAFLYVLGNALIWFILFLFTFFRMFSRNKRFTMWYVKLAGCWPCIIFWGILSIGGAGIASKIGAISQYSGILTAFSSMTWISGICYLLLWVLSIFWAFPIKRKIRKMRKGV